MINTAVIPAKAGIHWIVAKYDLPGLVEKLNYARGSLFEIKTWLTKGNKRNLIKNNEFESLNKDIVTFQ